MIDGLERSADAKEMRDHTLDLSQFVPAPLEEVFSFFSRPENLARITPPWLSFRILTPSPISMRSGTEIDYSIRWLGLPVRWRTLIRDYRRPFLFVDGQIRGPYSFWQHTHTFAEAGEGTRMDDLVRYRLPGGIAGDILHGILIRRQLGEIFDYRASVVKELFSSRGAGEGGRGRETDP